MSNNIKNKELLSVKLSKLYLPLFRKLELEYNTNHINQNKGPNNTYQIPIISGSGFTPVPQDNPGAFILTSPATLKTEIVDNKNLKRASGIKRFKITEDYAIQLSNNIEDRNKLFEISLRKLIKEFHEKDLDISNNDITIGITRLTFNMPGRSEDDIFLELVNNEGYEIRLWADCIKL